ncbi:hypothetical protein C1H46_024650 [Malus baccata]|uniref:Uncharacterized protein n=1 Tax=Malus baccata TaxID=106549 RepID=A0A540LTN2_MALBA|nr:hypothetical protein C1H46_024650 [Malus baccata]
MSNHNRGVHDEAQWWRVCHWTRCKWRDVVLYRGGGTCQGDVVTTSLWYGFVTWIRTHNGASIVVPCVVQPELGATFKLVGTSDVGAFGDVGALPCCGASNDVPFDDDGASCAIPFAGGAPSCFGSSGFVLFNGDTLPSFDALGADEFDGDASPYFGASGAVPFDNGVSPCFGASGAVAFDDVEALPSFGISGVGLLDGAGTGVAYRALPRVKEGEEVGAIKLEGSIILLICTTDMYEGSSLATSRTTTTWLEPAVETIGILSSFVMFTKPCRPFGCILEQCRKLGGLGVREALELIKGHGSIVNHKDCDGCAYIDLVTNLGVDQSFRILVILRVDEVGDEGGRDGEDEDTNGEGEGIDREDDGTDGEDNEGGDEDGVDGEDDEEEGDGKGVEVGEGADEDGVNGEGDEEEGDGEDIEVGDGANGNGELLKLEGRISLLTCTTDAL